MDEKTLSSPMYLQLLMSESFVMMDKQNELWLQPDSSPVKKGSALGLVIVVGFSDTVMSNT